MARIQISNDPSGRIILSFPYDPLLVEKVKSIDGRRWHPVEKHWSFQPTLPSPLAGEGGGEGYKFEGSSNACLLRGIKS